MNIENAMNIEIEIYEKHFKLGFEDGEEKATSRIKENGFSDGIETGISIGYYIGYLNFIKNIIYKKLKDIEKNKFDNDSDELENQLKFMSKLKLLFGRLDKLLYNEEDLIEEYNLNLIDLEINNEVLNSLEMDNIKKLFKLISSILKSISKKKKVQHNINTKLEEDY